MTLDRLADPTFFADNRLPAHSDHRWYASRAEADSADSSFEACLDGVWKMSYAPRPELAVDGFWDEDHDVSDWDDIPVPAHIQLHGYDRPQYVNTQYPWDGHEPIDPGQIPTRYNPVASYVRSFTLPEALPEGERLILRLEGAESAVEVWVNGAYIGYSEDSFLPSEFDLTGHVRPGANRLAVRVTKWSSGSWLEDQDFYRFSGLFRSVYLRRLPRVHLADLRVGVEVSRDLTSAVITVRTSLEGEGSLRATLTDGVTEAVMAADEDGVLRTALTNPRLWSTEDPFLYDLTVEVLDADGRIVEVVPQPVGVRRFGVEDGVLCINGRRVVFKGVNRHEFGPQGRVMTREMTEADLIALKRANVNAIRTSHYPNNSFFYELCDRYGFYVIDEANLETHGVWDVIVQGRAQVSDAVPGDKPEWREATIDRARSMYERDKNHPCIVMWSCGNESFGGSTIAAMSELLRSLDSRPIHYEGVFHDPRHPQTSDVVSQMYTSADAVATFLETHRDKPFILCEYAHTMGNSFGAVDRYLDLAENEPLFQGGFIWDFADQAIALPAPGGGAYWGYGGDCGEAPHDGDFCGNGIFYADHTPSPKVQEVRHVYRPLLTRVSAEQVSVTNRFLFTGSADLECVVVLEEEGRTLATAVLPTDVAAGRQASYPQPLTVPERAGEYTITVSFRLREDTSWAPAGFVVADDQAVVTVEETEGVAPRPLLAAVGAGAAAPQLVRGRHNVGVRGTGFQVIFSQLAGALTSYRFGVDSHGGGELLRAPVRPCFWHAPTANERGYAGPFTESAWHMASRYQRAVNGGIPRVSQDDDSVTVGFTYELSGLAGTTCSIDYRVLGDGTVEVLQRLEPSGDLPPCPEFATLLEVPGALDRLTFYGEGPQECYVDRRGGARLGVHRASVAEQMAGYLVPQESGSHTAVRWAEVRDRHGRGLRIEAPTGQPIEFSALEWTPFQVEDATHPFELPVTGRTVLRPALMRRGVAGDDSWGARPHAEYCLPAGPMELRYRLRGVL